MSEGLVVARKTPSTPFMKGVPSSVVVEGEDVVLILRALAGRPAPCVLVFLSRGAHLFHLRVALENGLVLEQGHAYVASLLASLENTRNWEKLYPVKGNLNEIVALMRLCCFLEEEE